MSDSANLIEKKPIKVVVRKSKKTGYLYCAVTYGDTFLTFDKAICSQVSCVSVAELLSREQEIIIYDN